MSVLLYPLDATETHREEARWELHKNATCCFVKKNPWNWTHQNSSCMATYLPSQKPFKYNKQDMLGIASEVRTNSQATFSHELLHMDTPVLAHQLRLISALCEYMIQSRGPPRSDRRWEQVARETRDFMLLVLLDYDMYINIYSCNIKCFKSQCINKVHNHFKRLNTSYLVAISNVLKANVVQNFLILPEANLFDPGTITLEQYGLGSNSNCWILIKISITTAIQIWIQADSVVSDTKGVYKFLALVLDDTRTETQIIKANHTMIPPLTHSVSCGV